jgi:hypothetical protein
MLKDIVAVEALPNFRLRLRFEDGVAGEIAMPVAFEGVFAPLRDPEMFAQARVNPEYGTVVWPNGADLDPDVLHGLVTGQPARVREKV